MTADRKDVDIDMIHHGKRSVCTQCRACTRVSSRCGGGRGCKVRRYVVMQPQIFTPKNVWTMDSSKRRHSSLNSGADVISG